MAYGICLHVWGEYACFTRPEMKAERVSYDIITPSAARGVLEAIYWKPAIRWVIDRIHVLKPVQFTSVRRNEVERKASSPTQAQMNGADTEPLGILIEDERQQRASLLLRDVAYLIEAHFEMLDDGVPGKHLDIFNRRARRGQYFHHPYMGTREFPAHFRLIETGADPPASSLHREWADRDLGFMLHDIEFTLHETTREVIDAQPRFFRAELKSGVVTVPPLDEAHTKS